MTFTYGNFRCKGFCEANMLGMLASDLLDRNALSRNRLVIIMSKI